MRAVAAASTTWSASVVTAQIRSGAAAYTLGEDRVGACSAGRSTAVMLLVALRAPARTPIAYDPGTVQVWHASAADAVSLEPSPQKNSYESAKSPVR